MLFQMLHSFYFSLPAKTYLKNNIPLHFDSRTQSASLRQNVYLLVLKHGDRNAIEQVDLNIVQ